MIREMHWSPKTVDVQGCKFRPALKWGTWIACSPAGQRSPVMPHAHIKLQLPPPGSVDAEASTLQGQGGCRPCPAALPGTSGCRTRWQQRLDCCLWHDPGQSIGRNTDPATSFAAKQSAWDLKKYIKLWENCHFYQKLCQMKVHLATMH